LSRILILGAGGHGIVVATILRASGIKTIDFIDNDPALKQFEFDGISVIGTEDKLASLVDKEEIEFICGVGGTGDNARRTEIFDRAVKAGLRPIKAIHPEALVDANSEIGEGSAICVGAIINVGVEIGKNVIVNSGAIVEHHCQIGDHAHVSSGAVLCGNVTVGAGAHVGAGATVRQGVNIGRGSVIGAGAIVVADVADGVTVISNGAKPLS
jgi:sugar O-acyltransferase (sialic acid O-acetyltransferase NeuD family)